MSAQVNCFIQSVVPVVPAKEVSGSERKKKGGQWSGRGRVIQEGVKQEGGQWSGRGRVIQEGVKQEGRDNGGMEKRRAKRGER
jgi:hypothetical protein